MIWKFLCFVPWQPNRVNEKIKGVNKKIHSFTLIDFSNGSFSILYDKDFIKINLILI